MTRYGTVISFDRGRLAGLLKPDVDGAPLVFKCADQAQFFPEPRPFQRYSFTVFVPCDGGKPRAVNLSRQLTHREQAEAQRG